ncbi:MAG: hypothetical protein AAF745_11390, partial [Planctomycetota bacterium]
QAPRDIRSERVFTLLWGTKMSLEPLNLGPLVDAQSRFQRQFQDFAKLWQTAKKQWRDDRARQFEQERLAALGPSLSRFATSLAELTDELRKSQVAVADPRQSNSELY